MKFATDIEMLRLKSMKVSIAYKNTYNRHLYILSYLFKKNKPLYQIQRPILSLIWYGYLNEHKPTGWRHYVLIQDLEIFFRTCTDVRCHGHHAALSMGKSRATIYSREVMNEADTYFVWLNWQWKIVLNETKDIFWSCLPCYKCSVVIAHWLLTAQLLFKRTVKKQPMLLIIYPMCNGVAFIERPQQQGSQ